MSLFPSIFSDVSLYGEYVVRSFLPGGWCFFLPCDHGLDFFSITQTVGVMSERFRLYGFVGAAAVLQNASAPTTRVSFSFPYVCLECRFFRVFLFYFCTIFAFFLYGECVVRFFLPDGVFPPCDHGLDF